MKKVLALVLSLVMVFGIFSVCASAAEDTPVYVVLGDSIAYGSGLSNPKEACYGKIVADTNGYEYINHSIPGHTTTNLIRRLGEDTVIADVEKADIISISIGGNDFLTSNLFGLMFDAIVLKDYAEYDRIAEGFYTNFCTIVDMINDLNPDAVILMQTLYNPQSGYLRDPYQQGADRINSAIYRYAEENPGEIEIVDVGTALGEDMENYAGDEIHPSVAGNEIIAVEVLEKLYDLGLGENTQPVINEKGTDIEIPQIFTASLRIAGNIFNAISVVYNFVLSIINAF